MTGGGQATFWQTGFVFGLSFFYQLALGAKVYAAACVVCLEKFKTLYK